ncbi:MAG: cytochrome b N-terminal domain-containing protein [Alphaproteobacteria bacterium]|nr:cytochrome b N-terminal domain-containing protein [Alphaproteobacteria bacterium]
MSGGHSTYTPTNGFTKWLDSRLPLIRVMNDNVTNFPTPKNLNYWYTFGAILTFCLAVQLVTGIVLAMHYVASADKAFASIEYIMRDVNYGWLIRYVHMNGASMFFLAVYVHMFRGLYYGSYKAPREILWILGVIIYFLMMATAFLGYTLPWGQMSFWGATVITNFFSAFDQVIPGLGSGVLEWLRGDFAVDDAAVKRFFALHYLLPFVIAGVVFLHIWALHVPGNNNPTGIDVKGPQDTVPFHPYYTVKDGFATAIFMMLFAVFVFYAPNYLGHPDNYVEANPLVTPAHIVPEWYFLPFYAILRAVPDKLTGVLLMFGAIGVLFFVPWLDWSKVRSASYRPVFRQFFVLFVIACLALGWAGAQPAEGAALLIAQVGTFYYFIFFIFIMPVVGLWETPRKLPESIAKAVLAKNGHAAVQPAQ